MLCWFLPYNSVNQPSFYIYIYIHMYIYPLPLEPPSFLLFHPSGSSQSVRLCSLCYIAASHWLSTLHMLVSVPFSSVAQSYLTLQPHEVQHARPPCPSPTPRACSNSCPSSRGCHPTILSSVHLIHVLVYICQSYFLNLTYPLFPLLCLQIHSLHLLLHSFPANRFVSTIFLDAIYVCVNI